MVGEVYTMTIQAAFRSNPTIHFLLCADDTDFSNVWGGGLGVVCIRWWFCKNLPLLRKGVPVNPIKVSESGSRQPPRKDPLIFSHNKASGIVHAMAAMATKTLSKLPPRTNVRICLAMPRNAHITQNSCFSSWHAGPCKRWLGLCDQNGWAPLHIRLMRH